MPEMRLAIVRSRRGRKLWGFRRLGSYRPQGPAQGTKQDISITFQIRQYGALSFKCSASGRPLESQRGNGSGINSIGGGNADKPSSYNYEKDDGSVDRYILHGD